jgi:nitrogen fixation-related uncharacterized protein
MAQQSSNSAGTSAGRGQKKRDNFIALVVLGFIILAFFWGIKLGWFTDQSASEAQARSGEYRMYDVTDESPQGAANREKFVQISFTAEGMSFEYPLILPNGREVRVFVSGTTSDGRTYFLRHTRSDQDEPSSALERCEFEARSGTCETPNIVGGLNTTTFTKL